MQEAPGSFRLKGFNKSFYDLITAANGAIFGATFNFKLLEKCIVKRIDGLSLSVSQYRMDLAAEKEGRGFLHYCVSRRFSPILYRKS